MSAPPVQAKLLSGDGSTVIGVLGNGTAGRWRISSGTTELGTFTPSCVDDTGDVICGFSDSTAVRHTTSDGLQLLPPPENYTLSIPRATSSNYLVGQVSPGGAVFQAASWINGGWQPVALPTESTWSGAVDVSRIGVIAGNYQSSDGFRRSFWAWGGNTYLLEGPNGSQSWIWDTAVGGNVFVGVVPIPNDPYPFAIGIPHLACVWAFGSGPNVLPLLPNTQRSDARATSEWGHVIVGTSYGNLGYRATVWAGERGPFDLNRYVECYTGVAPTSVLTVAIGVSDNGRTILALSSDQRLFLITGFEIPLGPITDLNGDSSTDGADLGLLLVDWGACSPNCSSDINRDGEVNGADLGLLLINWGNCI
jgi:uncharacterized membrane protein